MSAEYATFGLAPAMRAGGVLANGDYQVHRDFVDFIVDGRPLLFQLSDLDAVSPLAADIPPAIFTDHVRSLLLEAEAPLAEGRYVIYGCPECEGLECGAVTATIEKTGDGRDDYVWRDFAWQTDDHADLELNGYHGIGPFRFRGDEYRSALGQLLTPQAEPGAGRRVLLIGARVAVLAKLAAALRTIGIGADITQDATGVPSEELRGYGAVAFGRAVDAAQRAATRREFERADADVAYVDGLAPIIPLLVAQIESALDRSPAPQRRLTRLVAADGEAGLEVTSTCRVRLTAYRLDRLYRTHTHEVFDDVLDPGQHRISLDNKATKGESFLVARTTGSVLVAPMAR
ncbi:oxidoreductase [Streptomyces sp. VRA16 Mangrove soil]|uniref:oxidoreductase n=1 Tax=Streptomyces sp. VRA16 Mangrove soil TaxID=2817434 RepID=UPI001A9D46DE|nr:oxidoreductase [Streptomyces sp. VRA16 Mangrove soil]MBO1329678.1 oxidoreductase [Streptomyces sp. VRA16 Mangrove soil]